MIEMTPQEFEKFRLLIHQTSGINLGQDKRQLLATRLMKRMRVLELVSFQQYYDLFQGPEQKYEMSHLIDAISTNKTDFFREPQHFDFMRQTILPGLMNKQQIRIWSAACSSGEEPLTIAMVLGEHLNLAGRDVKVLATDISNEILDHAERGIYAKEKTAPIAPELLQKYFRLGTGQWEGHYQAKDNLTRVIHYRRLNLVEPFPLSIQMDVIFCRNVMIYFDKPTQEAIINKFEQQLTPGGYLLIGHSESLSGIQSDLEYVQPTIYRKKG